MGHVSRFEGLNAHLQNNLNRTNKLLPKAITMCRKNCDFFFPSDFHKNKGLIPPAGKFCKITLQSASTKPANTTQAQTSPILAL